jgi:hypothetical protein
MNEFFTKISGQIVGAMILSAFFPTVLFVAALALVVLPGAPFGHELVQAVKSATAWQQDATAALKITFLILVLSVMLYYLNTPIVRMYEGYPWKDSWIGWLFLKWQKHKFQRASFYRRCIAKLRVEKSLAHVDIGLVDLVAVNDKLARLLNDSYPNRASLVLPTRFGNVIRAFETYTDRQYGAGSIALWPRLQGVLDQSCAQALDNAKTSVDFMINSSFLSLLLAIMSLAIGLAWRPPVAGARCPPWMAWVLCFALLSYLFYLGAINCARAWGMQVKAAFDLNRLSLLAKLGYETKAADLAEERRMWEVINYKFAFPDERTYPDLPYHVPATFCIVDPVSTIVTFDRNLHQLDTQQMEVKIVVANTDPTRAPAARVGLRDEIPAGKEYVWGSATVDGAPARILDYCPLKIDIGPLSYYQARTVVYSVKGQKPVQS